MSNDFKEINTIKNIKNQVLPSIGVRLNTPASDLLKAGIDIFEGNY